MLHNHICKYLELWMDVNQYKTSMLPPAMAKMSVCGILLSTTRGTHWLHTPVEVSIHPAEKCMFFFWIVNLVFIRWNKSYSAPCFLSPSYRDLSRNEACRPSLSANVLVRHLADRWGAICRSIMNKSVVHTVWRGIRTAAVWHDTQAQMSSPSPLQTD